MTTFEYAAFISYRNSRQRDNGLLSTFARELAIALGRVVDAYLYEDIGQTRNSPLVFLDENIIKSGDWIVPEISEGLFRSVCWIVLYSRNYLGGSLFCASELKGMIELSKSRSTTLGNLKNNLIIPVLFRGDDSDMPQALKRIAYNADFRRFSLASKNIAELDEFTQQIEDIAELIAQRQKEQCEKSRSIPIDLCQDYHQFRVEDVSTKIGKRRVAKFINQLKKPDFPVI